VGGGAAGAGAGWAVVARITASKAGTTGKRSPVATVQGPGSAAAGAAGGDIAGRDIHKHHVPAAKAKIRFFRSGDELYLRNDGDAVLERSSGRSLKARTESVGHRDGRSDDRSDGWSFGAEGRDHRRVDGATFKSAARRSMARSRWRGGRPPVHDLDGPGRLLTAAGKADRTARQSKRRRSDTLALRPSVSLCPELVAHAARERATGRSAVACSRAGLDGPELYGRFSKALALNALA